MNYLSRRRKARGAGMDGFLCALCAFARDKKVGSSSASPPAHSTLKPKSQPGGAGTKFEQKVAKIAKQGTPSLCGLCDLGVKKSCVSMIEF
jgi:hypothetical protein